MPYDPDAAIRPSSEFSLPPSLTLSLHFVNISYRIKIPPTSPSGNRFSGFLSSPPSRLSHERAILEGITGIAAAGELLAVLGPSGSGKSTLLTILAGRTHPHHSHTGSIFANGRRATRSDFRRIGFVPQDDVLYPHLTVRETLTYCAMLKLPRDRVLDAVESVMAELGLKACGETAVGGAFVRGVSGGERKRVAIGHEMLVNPRAVVVDEPTSGLDATAAGRMVETLKGMARRGRAVIASVHQPASRVYKIFDSVMLMAEGRCVYYGKGKDAVDYFKTIGFSPEVFVNPADFMIDLANGVIRVDSQENEVDKAGAKQSLISSYNRVLAPIVKASVNASIAAASMASGVNEVHIKSREREDLREGTNGLDGNQLGPAVRHTLGAGAEREAARGVRVPPDAPGGGGGVPGGVNVVALQHFRRARPPRAPLLRLHLLGCLRLIQRCLHLPPGAADPLQGARLRHVLPLLLLRGPHGRRPPHGARPPIPLRPRPLLDGQPPPRDRRLLSYPGCHPLLRPGRPGPRSGSRRRHHERQAGLHRHHHHHARLSPHRRLLRAEAPPLHGVAEIHLLHLLLLQAAHWGAVQAPRAQLLREIRCHRGRNRGADRRAVEHHRPGRNVLRVQDCGLRSPEDQDIIIMKQGGLASDS